MSRSSRETEPSLRLRCSCCMPHSGCWPANVASVVTLITAADVLWFLRRLEPLFLLRRGLLVRRGLESVIKWRLVLVTDAGMVVVNKVERLCSAIRVWFSLTVMFSHKLSEVRGDEVKDIEIEAVLSVMCILLLSYPSDIALSLSSPSVLSSRNVGVVRLRLFPRRRPSPRRRPEPRLRRLADLLLRVPRLGWPQTWNTFTQPHKHRS